MLTYPVSHHTPKNAGRALRQGPCSTCQASKLFEMVDLEGIEHLTFLFAFNFTFVVNSHLKYPDL